MSQLRGVARCAVRASLSCASRLRSCARPRAACCCCCPAHSSSRWATCAACYCCSPARQYGQAPAWQCPSSVPAPPQGAPGVPRQRSAPRGEPGPLGTQPPPPVLERAAFNVADPLHLAHFRLGAARAVRRGRDAATPACDTAATKARTDGGAGGAVGRHAPHSPTPKVQHAQSPREVSYNTV